MSVTIPRLNGSVTYFTDAWGTQRMSAHGPERRLLPAPTWSRLGAKQTPLEVARMTRLTQSDHRGGFQFAPQQMLGRFIRSFSAGQL